jgi:hypothetical protein
VKAQNYCDDCHERLCPRRPPISRNGASLSLYTCPLCGAAYALIAAYGERVLLRYAGDGVWETVNEPLEVALC